MFIPRIWWFYGNCFVNYNSVNMLILPLNASREIFQFFPLCCSYQAKISQVIRSLFFYVRNSLHSCIYLSFFLIFQDRVTRASFFFASEHRQRGALVNVIVARRRELLQKPNLCLWGAWNFPQKIFPQRKFRDNFFSLYQ